MRDIYVKTHVHWPTNSPAVRSVPAEAGYHPSGKLEGFSVCRIIDVPESVSDARAIFAFNDCAVLGHTVRWEDLKKDQPVRGIGMAWDSVAEVIS